MVVVPVDRAVLVVVPAEVAAAVVPVVVLRHFTGGPVPVGLVVAVAAVAMVVVVVMVRPVAIAALAVAAVVPSSLWRWVISPSTTAT